MIEAYDWAGGREAMLRFGPATGPVVLAAMPLFEEANRMRAFLVTLLRALGDHGIGAALPDLPGTGESVVPTQQARLHDWRTAFAAAEEALTRQGARVHALAMRGGALVDTRANVAGRWHFAPVTGAALVRDLVRAKQAATKESGEAFDAKAIGGDGPPIELAGNLLSRELIAELQGAGPVAVPPLRTVRLDTDAAAADLKIVARPLWRRAEPDNNPALARDLATDVAAWVRQCAN